MNAKLTHHKLGSFKNGAIHTLALFFFCLVLCTHAALATVTITTASGGTTISADKAANATSPAYSTLGNIVITEGANADFSAGTAVTFTINAPTGWSL